MSKNEFIQQVTDDCYKNPKLKMDLISPFTDYAFKVDFDDNYYYNNYKFFNECTLIHDIFKKNLLPAIFEDNVIGYKIKKIKLNKQQADFLNKLYLTIQNINLEDPEIKAIVIALIQNYFQVSEILFHIAVFPDNASVFFPLSNKKGKSFTSWLKDILEEKDYLIYISDSHKIIYNDQIFFKKYGKTKNSGSTENE